MTDPTHTFSQENEINGKLNTDNLNKIPQRVDLKLSMKDISNLAVLKYGGVNAFGRALGVTQGMASQLLSGNYVPLRAGSIHKIANCLGIDPVTLSQIYSEIKKEREHETTG